MHVDETLPTAPSPEHEDAAPTATAPTGDATDAPEDAAAPPAALLRRIVEAALLAAPQPQTLAQLYALFPEDRRPAPGSIEHALEDLRAEGRERGVELVEVASGFRFQVAGDIHPWITGLWTERQTRYTRATLETLALIAYRQPITRGEIEQIRGVAVSSNIIKTLEEREWIRVIGHRDVPGRPALFGTTKQFLDYFGLKSLDGLPPLSELRDLNELDPQLPFDTEVPAEAKVRLSDLPDEDDEDDGAAGSGEDGNTHAPQPLDEDAERDDAAPAAAPEGAESALPAEDGNTHDLDAQAPAAASSTEPGPAPAPVDDRQDEPPPSTGAVATTTAPTDEADAQGIRPEHKE